MKARMQWREQQHQQQQNGPGEMGMPPGGDPGASVPPPGGPPPAGDPQASSPPPPASSSPPPASSTPPPASQPAANGSSSFRAINSAEDLDAALEAGKGNVVLPQSAMRRIKDQLHERGMKAALAEAETQAKAAGFSSFAEAIGAAADAKKNAGKRQPMIDKKSQEQLAAANKVAEEAKATAKREERKRIEAESRAAQNEAKFHVREQVLLAGIKPADVDYVADRLEKTIARLSDEQVASFDEAKFFEELRKEKPYVFVETQILANTGTGNSQATPAAPKPSQVPPPKGTDAREMSPLDFKRHMRAAGYRSGM